MPLEKPATLSEQIAPVAERVTAGKSFFAAQPRGVFLLASTEFWERFSYYGMLGLLVLFLVDSRATGGMGWDNASALRLSGIFIALSWFAPVVGGFLADHVISARRAVILGCVSLSLGNFTLASLPFLPGNGAVHVGLFAGLALMIIGSGLFKSNASVLLGGLFDQGDSRREFGFTIFYMGINLGALVAPFIAGTAGERMGWHYGFFLSGLGMAIGAAVFLHLHRRLLGSSGLVLGSQMQRAGQDSASGVDDIHRIQVIVIFGVFATIFAAGLMQYGSVMNLFASQNVDRMILGFEVPATWFLVLNPLFIVLFGPFVARIWDARLSAGSSASPAHKFAVGLILMSAAFFVIAFAASESGEAKTHWIWMIIFYLLLTTGELCVVPVGLALVSRVAPARWLGLAMGAWLLTNAIGSWAAGEFGVLGQQLGNPVAFTAVGCLGAVAAAVLFLIKGRVLRRAHGTI